MNMMQHRRFVTYATAALIAKTAGPAKEDVADNSVLLSPPLVVVKMAKNVPCRPAGTVMDPAVELDRVKGW